MIEEQTKNMLSRVSSPISVAEVSAKYPMKYEESMNTVLVQEVSSPHWAPSVSIQYTRYLDNPHYLYNLTILTVASTSNFLP